MPDDDRRPDADDQPKKRSRLRRRGKDIKVDPITKRPTKPDPEAGELTQLWRKAVNTLRNEHMNYWLNYAFLDGAQWVWWNQSDNRLVEQPRDDQRARATIDRMGPNTRTIIAKATQRHLSFEVLPDGADDAHIRGARISETILRTLHTEHDWEILRERHLQAMWKGGTAAICVDWNPNAKDVILPATDDGRPAIHEGETVETVLSIAEFCVEPGARDPERARYWFKALTLPPKEVQAMYDLDWCPPADASSAQLPYMNRFAAGSGVEAESKSTLVLTYYERPNPLNEEGRIAVIVDGQIVHDAEWPFPTKDRLNLFVGRETVVEDKWAGTTILNRARPIQVAINAAWSSIIEHMKRAGNARLAVPQSALDSITALTDQAAEFIPYNDGVSSPPQWISPPQMPNWWVEAPERLQLQLDDVMGVHDVSRGTAPTNAPDSGYGISLLIEQDTTPVGRMVKETARVWSDVASFVLKLYEQQTKAPRKTNVQLPGQPPQTISWSGKDLLGQTRATVPVDQIIPRSRAAQMALAEKMMQMQLITSAAQFAKIAELPSQTDFLSGISADIVRARRENALLGAGQVALVKDFDDHQAHIMEHNDFRKSAHYEMMPAEQQLAVDNHVKGHEVEAARLLGQRAAGGAIHPLLAGAPTAAGTPPVDPALAAPPMPDVDPAAMAAEGAPSEEELVQQALAEMEQANPVL